MPTYYRHDVSFSLPPLARPVNVCCKWLEQQGHGPRSSPPQNLEVGADLAKLTPCRCLPSPARGATCVAPSQLLTFVTMTPPRSLIGYRMPLQSQYGSLLALCLQSVCLGASHFVHCCTGVETAKGARPSCASLSAILSFPWSWCSTEPLVLVSTWRFLS